jgi:hypothetical protein
MEAKYRFLQEPHGVTYEKSAFFISIAVFLGICFYIFLSLSLFHAVSCAVSTDLSAHLCIF